MAALVLIDTHVALWLAMGELDRLSPAAIAAIGEADRVALSPVSVLELAYLVEAERVTREAAFVVQALTAGAGLVIDDVPLGKVIVHGVAATWTRDPFDRMLVGHATSAGAALVTKDRTIRANFPNAVW